MKKLKLLATVAVAATMSLGGAIAFTACRRVEDNEHERTYSSEWTTTATHHYHAATCEHTDEKKDYGEHVYDDAQDTDCNTCGYVRTVTPAPETTGTVSGTVTAYGKALNGVKVAVGSNDTVTGATGKYSLDGVDTENEVTVTFSKSGYITVKKKIAVSAWTEKETTLDADMRLAEEKTTVSGVIKYGTTALSGATVTLGDKTPVTTGADGAYTFEVDSSAASSLTLTVSHPYCENHSEAVAIEAGNGTVTKDVTLTAKTVSVLGNKTLFELGAMTASNAEDYSFLPANKGGSGIDSWERSGSNEQANEGLLFHEAGQDIASGSTELKLYAYKKLTFNETEQITVLARRFGDPTHNANLQGGGYPEVYILLVAEDGTVITPKEKPGEVVSTTDESDNLVFTFDEKISGNYIFAVGTTRGNRAAIQGVQFRGEEVSGTVTGTIKQNGAALSGVEVKFGDTTVTTGNDGTFSVEVFVRKGGSDKITVSKDGVSMDIPFTAEDLVGGTYALGEKILKAAPLPGVTEEMLGELTATAATNITSINDAKTEFAKWQQVGRDNGSANEGWLLRDAGYADIGSTDLKVFIYTKLTFTNTQAIVVKARTFTDQNNVDGHQNVHPEMILKLIGADGRSVNVNYNVCLVDTNDESSEFYFTLDNAISGDYVLAIGMARGQRLALAGIEYLAAGEVVEQTVTGVVKYGSAAQSGANVSYTYGYNVTGTTTTDAEGQFTLPVVMRKNDSVTLNIRFENDTESASKKVTLSASQFTDGVCNAGDIALSKTYLPGLTSDDIEELEVRTDTVFGHSNDGNGAIQRNWSKYGDVDWGHGEGACIQRNSTTPVSYMYAKFTASNDNKFMKFNARMFVRDSDQNGHLQVKVISADGTMEVVAPMIAVRGGVNVSATNIQNKTLINDNDGYTEGVYDLSAYIGQTIVIIIQDTNEEVTKNIHNAINEIAFKSYPFYTEGSITGTVNGDNGPVADAVVTVNGMTVKTDSEGRFCVEIFTSDASLELTVQADGYKKHTSSIQVTQFTNGACELEAITLETSVTTVTLLPGLTNDDAAELTVLSETTFGTDAIYDKWGKHGDIAKHGEGTCIQNSANLDAAYIYGKFEITADKKYMKFNARMFVRDDDQKGLLQVKVIDGSTVTELAPIAAYRGGEVVTAANIQGNVLVNDDNGYTEGVYDLSAYIGKTVVIVIQDITTEYDKKPNKDENKDVHNAINEIAFRANPFYAAGTVSGTVTEGETPVADAIVSVNGRNVTTGSDGKFSMEVVIGYTDEITVSVTKNGYAKSETKLTGSEIVAANGEKDLGNITLTVKTFAEIIGEQSAGLTAINLDDRHQFGSTSSGGADGWENSGYNLSGHDIYIPYGEYIYAKLKITDSYQFMKFNARDRENFGSKMLLMVYVDGQLTELAPSRVYGTNQVSIDGNYLINDRGNSYNEGVYDFSAYVGQEIVVVIQTVACLDGKTEAYTECNEIAFFGSINCDKGDNPDPNNYYEVSGN